jgi:hypothetical protein
MRKLRGWAYFGLKGRLNNIARTTPWFGSTSRRGLIIFKTNINTVVAEQPCSHAARRLGEVGTAALSWAGDSRPKRPTAGGW